MCIYLTLYLTYAYTQMRAHTLNDCHIYFITLFTRTNKHTH